MTPLRDLLSDLDLHLEPERYRDFGPNGLQVPGAEEIELVVTGVSAHAELLERAADLGADLVLVHHGLFWDRDPRALDRVTKRRLELLFRADMALAAYHLPLDGHLEAGNAALLAQRLGAVAAEPFGVHGPATVGVAARFDEPLARAELVARVAAACDQEPLAFPAGPDPVRSLGIVTGAGTDHVVAAAAAGLDAFLTGEPAERAMALAREHGITFLAGGHHATERLGIRRLGDRLADRFDVRHSWVDVPNPV